MKYPIVVKNQTYSPNPEVINHNYFKISKLFILDTNNFFFSLGIGDN